jgi:hypothetical protein
MNTTNSQESYKSFKSLSRLWSGASAICFGLAPTSTSSKAESTERIVPDMADRSQDAADVTDFTMVRKSKPVFNN